MTLDLDAMFVAQISPDTKLDLQQRGVTVGQMLQAAMEPVGLKFTEEGGQIVIGPQANVNQESSRSPMTFPILPAPTNRCRPSPNRSSL